MTQRSAASKTSGDGPASAAFGGGMGYRQILAQLVQEIQAGHWAVGGKLPTENELMTRFGVSRHTVREALRGLQDQGYLSKRRGTRSTILRAVPEQNFLNSIGSVDELFEYARAADNVLMATDHVLTTAAQAARLGCDAGRAWLRMQFLRRPAQGQAPFCYSEVYLDPAYAAVAEDFDCRDSVYSALQKRFGDIVARVEQEIEADAASEAVALRLQVPVGSPVLLARTSFFAGDGRLIEVGMACFAAGRYRIRFGLDRKAAQLA